MSRLNRILLTLAALGVATLLAVGVVAGYIYVEEARMQELKRLSPDLDLGMEERVARGDWCFLVGSADRDGAPRFIWEDLTIEEHREDGVHRYAPPGVSGPVRVGQRLCGFSIDGFYDFVYEPTGLAIYSLYPGCATHDEFYIESCGKRPHE